MTTEERTEKDPGMFTAEQQEYIRNNYRKAGAKKIAKHLKLDPDAVQRFIETLRAADVKNRERLFRAITIASPFLLLLLVEMALRITGYGVDTRLFKETLINGKAYYAINDSASFKYFRNRQQGATVTFDVFEKEKSPETCRIFCLGESSTLGYPYMDAGSFPRMLKDRLQDLLPQKNIEMVNVGMTAISSFVVLDFAKQIMDYQPDLLLIYTGHNEFYGTFAVGSSEYLGRNVTVIRLYFALEQFKTFQLLRQSIGWAAGLFRSADQAQHHGTLMENMVRNKAILYHSDDYYTALNNFRGNLEEIVSMAKAGHVPVVIGTLASNLRGLPPFISLFSPTTPEDRKQQWESLFARGTELYRAGNYRGALDTLRLCVAIDSLPAKLQFSLGQCYEQLEEYASALVAYRNARDVDGLHFRAPTDFNAMMADLCVKESIPLAHSEEMVAERCAHGIIGNEMMLEHVHPNIDGYFTIAKAFGAAIADAQLIAPRREWHWEKERTDSAYRSMTRLPAFDSVVAAMRINVLTHSWPFTDRSINVNDIEPHTDLERRAKNYLTSDAGWEQAHVEMAEAYRAAKQNARAAEEYRELIRVIPFNSSPYLRLGLIYISMKDTVAAESTLKRSLLVEKTFTANNLLGIMRVNHGDYHQAAAYFEEALNYGQDAPQREYQQAKRLLNAIRKRER